MRRALRPRVGIIGIGDIKAEAQKRDYETIINGIKGLDIEVFDKGIKASTEEIEASVIELLRKELDAVLLVVLRGMSAQAIKNVVELMDCPAIVWAVKERWAWPSSALALGALKEEKKKVKLIYGLGDDKSTLNEFRQRVQAAFALSRLRHSRIGTIGSLFPNLVSRSYDKARIKERIGTEIVEISFDELHQAIGRVSKAVNAIEDLRKKIQDRFLIEVTDELLNPGIRLHLALKHIAKSHSLDGFAIECWSRMPKEVGLNPCLGFIEDDYTLTCEGDVLISIATQMVRYLTGINPYVGDIYDLDKENILTLVHCGAPASLAADAKSVIIKDSIQAKEQGFPTPVCHPQLKNGEVTLLSLYGKKCDYVHLTTGELIKTRRADKMWVKVRLSGERQEFLEQCLANHYIVVPGNIIRELELLCEWLAISILRT